MDYATGAVAAKAKAMYGRMLDHANYEELIHKKSVNEIAAYLKNETDYHRILSDVHEASIHRGQLENLLHRYVFDMGIRLVKFAGNGHKEFYSCNVMTQEMDQILSRIRLLNSDIYQDFLKDVPIYLNRYTSFDLMKLDSVKNFDDLLVLLHKTPYAKILEPFRPKDKNIDYTGCEMALRKYYFTTLIDVIRKSFKGKLRSELLTIVNTQIELENITKIYRYKKFFDANGDVIRNSLIDTESRISERFMEQLISAPSADAFMRLISESSYHLYVDDKDFVFIEYDCDRIRYHLAQRYMRFSSKAPLVYSVYLILLEIEVQNIINIIEGVRYGVPPENIEKMLIYTKGGA